MANTNLPFADGGVAYRETFLGREKEIRELEEIIFAGCGAVHLVGPPRIGKTSLIYAVCERNRGKTDRLCVKTSMGEAVNAYGFWINLAEDILEAISDAELWDRKFQRQADRIRERVQENEGSWFTILTRPLKSILTHLGELGFQLVLIIDEFDKVRTLFSGEPAYFQLLRSIYSEPDLSTSGAILSRRRLKLLENDCPDISTFHGVFAEYTLRGFSGEDMAAYDRRLLECGIELSEEERERLKYYTGTIPYLCCKLGNQMVRDSRDGTAAVDSAFLSCLPQINEYYDDLIARLKEDGQMDFVFYLSIGVRPPTVTGRELENLKTMGILSQTEGREGPRYYVYTQDFMTYVKELPLQLPAADMIRESEKKLRTIIQKRYPRLADLTCADLEGANGDQLQANINQMYPDLTLDWTVTMRNLKTNAVRNKKACVLDTFTLTFVINKILNLWDGFFDRYFGGDPNWKGKLEAIRSVRIPIAHSNIEYIEQKELAVCMQYCEELIRLEI